MTEPKKHGGSRTGAGRPKSPHKPVTSSIKFTNQAQKDKYLALGGNTWLKKTIDEA